MRQQRDTGTKLPRMYRRQPEYVDNGKQYFSDPEDDPECKPAVQESKPKGFRIRAPKRNKTGIVLGINLLLLGLVVYIMQTYLISNNGVLERDGMRYEVRAKENDGFVLVSLIVTQKDKTSPLSGKALTAQVTLVEHSKEKNVSGGSDNSSQQPDGGSQAQGTTVSEAMPAAAGDSRVLQTSLDLPAIPDPAALANYTVKVRFSAGQSNLIVNAPIESKTAEAKKGTTR